MLRELIEKLADLYPTIEAAEQILLYADVPRSKIKTDAAAETNWTNIFLFIHARPLYHLAVLEQVLIEMKEINEDGLCTFIQQRIDNLKNDRKTINETHKTQDPKNFFNIHSIFGNEYAFIDRQKVKTSFRRMILDGGPRNILITEGKRGAGLSYVHSYMAEVLSKFSNFKMVSVSPEKFTRGGFFEEDASMDEYKVTGADVAEMISESLKLGYSAEGDDKKSISKYTTFMTKLKEVREKENETPIICLDGLYKIINPSVNHFINQLLSEAMESKKFYVILSIDDEFPKDRWNPLLRGMPTLALNSFSEEDVKSYVKTVFSQFDEKIDLGRDINELTQEWMNRNAVKWSYEEEEMNVKEIGEECTRWYRALSNKIQEELDG